MVKIIEMFIKIFGAHDQRIKAPEIVTSVRVKTTLPFSGFWVQDFTVK
jgi:hypothetical protein